MSELAGRVVSASAQHLHVPAEGHADPHQQPKVVLPHTSGPNQLRPGAPHVEYHHTPYEAADSDPPRQGLHDGSTFAMGATGEPYDSGTPGNKPSVGQRIKEAIPGTKEHRAKKEGEGNLAVYT